MSIGRKILLFIVMLLAVVAAVAYFLLRGQTAEYTTEELSGPSPVLSAPKTERFPTIKIAEVVGWQEGEAPEVADGFIVERFVAGLDHPRQMLVLPNGDILVAETNSPPRENKGAQGSIMRFLLGRAGAGVPSANRISLVRDSDGDGIAEHKSVFLEGLNSPFGMELIGETLYVANTDAVLAFPYETGQEQITAQGEVIAELNAIKPNNHWTRNLRASPDGTKLYVAVGSNSNIGEHGLDTEQERAAILEIKLEEGNAKRVYASGLRNPVGMAVNPDNGALWTVVNERDLLGPDLVPDYMAEVMLGANFGWPHYYWGNREELRIAPLPNDISDYVRRPDYALGSHTAPLGIVFSHNSQFDGVYARGAFIARHGSWNRKPAAGYDVVFVPFGKDGYPAITRNAEGDVTGGLPVDLLTGFLNDDGDARGRPTMVTIDGTGALLVSDDVAGIIWRVRPQNPRVADDEDSGQAESAEG